MTIRGSNGVLELFALMGVIGFFIVGSMTAVRQAHRKREMLHKERMKALEMGLATQPSGLDWPAASLCIAVGAGVPIGTFVVTWLASITAHLPGEIWIAPGVVSLVAIGASTRLALRIIETKPRTQPASPYPTFAKPAFDPDAYDVVGSRG